MLNQIEARFSNFVSQFAPASSSVALDARLKLLESPCRSATEEANARGVEAQLFTDTDLLKRAQIRLSRQPARLARHICASLLAVAMFAGLGGPAHADEGMSSDTATTLPQQDGGSGADTLWDIIEELIEETVGDLFLNDDPDPLDGTQ